MSVEEFQSKHRFSKRCEESSKIMEKYKDRIPIIVLKHKSCELPTIDKHKYLVPKDMTFSQFIFVIRKRIHLDPSQCLFTSVNNQLVNSSSLVSDIYGHSKDKDGFLYVVYTSENTFG
tara:strand:- start:1603 stop:1956 length:354 start_codon:yes stop_codon:yes gene_type:complete